jgi:very-short-patch-repair endonuclease
MISLYEWAQQHSIAYSTATKMFEKGQLAGAIKDGRKTFVPNDTLPPARQTVNCAICNKPFPQITNTHLRQHGLTFEEYKSRYPDVQTATTEVRQSISDNLTGIVRSEEQKQRMSAGRKGIVPQNHPRFVKGAYTPTDETLQKMSEAQRGRVHSEETKQKIGDGNRGKIMPRDDVERRAESLRQKYKDEHHPNFGREFNDEHRTMMCEVALKREANYQPGQRAAINKAIGAAIKGIKRTDEQKETYRAARCKYMSENPGKFSNTSGEVTIAAWLTEHGIQYQQQYQIAGLHHPFDFYLPEYNTIIEFDGAHHWLRPWWNVVGKTEDELAAILETQKAKDANRTAFAEHAGYILIRIRGIADDGDCKEWGTLEEQFAAAIRPSATVNP